MPIVADPTVHKVYVLRREKFFKKLRSDTKNRGEFRKDNKLKLQNGTIKDIRNAHYQI